MLIFFTIFLNTFVKTYKNLMVNMFIKFKIKEYTTITLFFLTNFIQYYTIKLEGDRL